jgi:hypothetical protein
VYPQSDLKGQHCFSWLLPAKKKGIKKPSAQEEQLRLLRQILVELQTLNANFAASRTLGQQSTAEPSALTNNNFSDDEELGEYE